MDAGAPFREPGAATATCGDGVLDVGEECDDGSACSDGRLCTDDRYRCDGNSRASCQPRSGDGCSDSCRLERTNECGDSGAGAACNSGEMPAPSLPLDAVPPGGPASPGAGADDEGADDEGADDEGADDEPLDETDTSTDPPGCTWGAFGEPEPIRGLDANLSTWAPALAADGQTLYFAASASNGIEAIYAAQRERRARVSNPTLLAALDSGAGDGTPFVSFDGLSVYFYTQRALDGDRDLWLATRPDRTSEFGAPQPLPDINTFALDHLPWVSADELTLLFVSNRAGVLGQSDIWLGTRPTRETSFADVRPLEGVNSADDEGRAVLSRDGETIFFASARAGGRGGYDLWTATRDDTSLAFGPPENLGAISSPNRDIDPALSANERELWFSSDRDGSVKVWRSVRSCID